MKEYLHSVSGDNACLVSETGGYLVSGGNACLVSVAISTEETTFGTYMEKVKNGYKVTKLEFNNIIINT